MLDRTRLALLVVVLIAVVAWSKSPPPEDPNWAELMGTMERMHKAMAVVARSGDSDADFARLMLPHHQAAIEMAKTELLYGKDPQMRRLA
jgi:uncharacterized protein (DUF305 family)